MPFLTSTSGRRLPPSRDSAGEHSRGNLPRYGAAHQSDGQDTHEVSAEMISLLSIIALGFFLGMRHATDPDHVVAVTTIVSGQRNLTRAALTGVFWGIGHTLTILVVGAGIILFKVVISPWLGLGMELSVGLMLVALGLMNLFSFFRAMPKPSNQFSNEAKPTREPSHDHSGQTHAHFPGDPHEGHSRHVTPMPLATLDRALGT